MIKKADLDLLKRIILMVRPTIKPEEIKSDSKLVSDLGLESIDIIDIFFEIGEEVGVDLDLNEIAEKIGGTEGRRFNDIQIMDIISYINEK
jgi:acyl carrier protein